MQLVPTAYDLESALQEAIDIGLSEQYEEKSTVEVSEEKKTPDLSCQSASKDDRRNKGNRARRERRLKKRTLEAREQGVQDKQVARKRRKIIADTADCIVASGEAKGQAFKAAEGGWLGTRRTRENPYENDLPSLLASGFKLVKWDGKTPKAIVDKSGRVIAVLAGMPKDPFEEEVIASATAAFQVESRVLLAVEGVNSRGEFHAILVGFSHGGGTERPTETSTASVYARARKTLTKHPAVVRLAGFQNRECHSIYRNAVFMRNTRSIQDITQHDPSLWFPFVNTFPSSAFNLGPQTVCKPHKDFRNLSFGLCAITALGSFDPVKGGHLVLEELGLVVEFPPGSTVLIPSAFITHSNLKIGKDERRYSFTQYASGCIFSYVENGMRTDKTVLREGTEEEQLRWKTSRAMRWQKGLAMFPTLSSYE
ncbi:hypothetical protein J3R83DRAFT_10938 [Lanmaoa asiatica]|nr:hypothetical protein J3R83DRAFT_10938 [Lanmaoa asiatica]